MDYITRFANFLSLWGYRLDGKVLVLGTRETLYEIGEVQ